MIRVHKIAHASYEMPDLVQQTEYYTDILGLSLTAKDKDAVYLANTVDHHSVVLRKGDKPQCTRVGFQIAPNEDLGEFEKQTKAQGMKVTRKKDPEPSISDMLSFEDPKGTAIEVFKRDDFVPPEIRQQRRGAAQARPRRLPLRGRQEGHPVLYRRAGLP